jgi:hypothetical protein
MLRHFFIVILAIGSFSISAQTPAQKYAAFKADDRYRDGYIVTFNNQKKTGLVRRKANANAIIFVDSLGTDKKLGPKDVKFYSVNNLKYISNTGDFYLVMHESAKMCIYQREIVVRKHGAYIPVSAYFTKRPNEKKAILWAPGNFKDRVAKYFSDCDALRLKILNKEFTFDDVFKIVRFYEECPDK